MKVTLTQYELIEILDKLHPDAYDKLQQALERKIPDNLQGEWLEAWEAQRWSLDMTLSYSEGVSE